MPRMKSRVLGLATTVVLCATTASAEGDLLQTDELAEAIVAMTSPVWTGPRTPEPERRPRPSHASFTIRSETALVAVHASPRTEPTRMDRVLGALEYARGELAVMGWPAPLPDGGLGGGPELDVYLAPTRLPTEAHSDGTAWWTYLDQSSAFAMIDPETPEDALEACAINAYAEALLLSMDPAEAKAWRRATAAWLTWVLTGRFGCEDAVWQQQAEPFRSWVRGGAAEGAGGALLLAYLSARHDGLQGRFVRDAWELSTQRTWEGTGLRAEPDLWAALDTAVSQSGDRLLDNIEDLAVQRWFVGRGSTKTALVASIDADAKVPGRWLKRFPTRFRAQQSLRPFGSAYVVLDRTAWAPFPRLRAWLQGEYGVRWSFAAVQLDGEGNELQRMQAPQTSITPEAYLPIEIDSRARQLLFVVTNLSNRLPDADEPDVNQRAFELTIASAEE